MYVIEALLGDTNGFQMVDVVTDTKYIHKGQTPGVMIVYRVRAKRGDNLSIPSNEAAVYE